MSSSGVKAGRRWRRNLKQRWPFNQGGEPFVSGNLILLIRLEHADDVALGVGDSACGFVQPRLKVSSKFVEEADFVDQQTEIVIEEGALVFSVMKAFLVHGPSRHKTGCAQMNDVPLIGGGRGIEGRNAHYPIR